MGSKLRHRLPMALLVAACTATVAIAVSGASQPPRGLDFAPSGHWVVNPELDIVFHVNGAAKAVDAQAPMAIDPGSRVYQGETSAYVVGQSRIREFGKSSLEVERTLPAPTGEPPVGVEAPGGPYLVYREAGTVVRLGDQPATIHAGQGLGEPVVTPDGTLWLHRLATGVLCKLPRGADQVSCPAVAPRGHQGGLTVVGEQAAFVDTTDDTVRAVADGQLGAPVNLGVDLPGTARIATADTAGRIPALDPAKHQLHLIDTGGLSRTPPANLVTVDLPEGDYASPEPSGTSVVLLDLRGNAVHTYTSDGRPQGVTPVPPETGEPRLTRAQDARVYVDGDKGGHVMVVDEGGAVSQVPLVGEQKPGGNPQAPPPERQPENTQPPPPRADPPVQAGPPPTRNAPAPDPAPQREQPKPNPAPKPDPPPTQKPLPASPPGIATNLAASPQDGTLRVTWNAAAPNGAPVTAYHVSWQPATGAGSVSTPGSARSTVLSGLKKGTAYTVTVVAENSAGRGTAASTRVTVPSDGAPEVTVARGRTESHDAGCRPPECGLMLFTLKGFEPNKDYTVTPYSNAPGYPGDNPEDGCTTNGDGYYQDQAFPFAQVGYDVWVVVEGPDGQRYESNRYTWESG
ncbi:fibronectin type III domain-containing protein [Amycolatopsis nigrescens]|uniref:fibronectin type III domain-containing protein n=1 Tax=Amycolatopsis nigrescens TaxID=381445 RepID=UPI0012F74B6E|nr:fibronectin type III domain-containing protein [Amycolatopsis nigrescens]